MTMNCNHCCDGFCPSCDRNYAAEIEQLQAANAEINEELDKTEAALSLWETMKGV